MIYIIKFELIKTIHSMRGLCEGTIYIYRERELERENIRLEVSGPFWKNIY